MSINERTFIRTIVKWSKSAAILAVVTVLLVVGVFVKTAHANSMAQAQQSIIQLQSKASKIETHLEESVKEAEALKQEVQVRDEKLQKLEQENAELKG